MLLEISPRQQRRDRLTGLHPLIDGPAQRRRRAGRFIDADEDSFHTPSISDRRRRQ